MVGGPGADQLRRLAGAVTAEEVHVHGITDRLGLRRQARARAQLGQRLRLLFTHLVHQFGERRADLAHALAKGAHIAARHSHVQVTDLRVAVGGKHAVLAFGSAMVFRTGRGAQVQGVDPDLLAQRSLANLGLVHLCAAVGVVLAQGTGIADQQDDASAIARPVHALHGLHHAGKGIFVERMAGDAGGLDLRGSLEEARRVAALLQADQGLAQVVQAWGALDAVAKAHQAEADVAQLAP
ncbi:hypothetical protein D3C80_281650 [compost metagenome]